MDEYEIRRVPILRASTLGATGHGSTDAGIERVRRGLYVPTTAWPAKEREARHFVRMQAAVASMARAPVFSHRSAAVLWGIPVIGPLGDVHIIAAGRVGVRSQRGIVWHNDAIADDDIVTLDGFTVTSLERTLIDVACIASFAAGVAAIDSGLRSVFVTPLGTPVRGADAEELRERADAAVGRRGIRTARSAIAFGDPRSGSPGESASRANMHVMRFPPPELQVPFLREDGGHDIVDFDWPDHGAFGECDGEVKYTDPRYMNGRSPERVLLDERERERRVRRYRPNAIRWGWDVAISAPRLARRLIHHGLRPLP